MQQSNANTLVQYFSLQQISKTDTIRLSEKISKFETF